MNEIIVPFGRISYKLPQYKGVKPSLLNEPIMDRIDIDYCEVSRGFTCKTQDGRRADFVHPLDPDATIHFCPYHNVVLFWQPTKHRPPPEPKSDMPYKPNLIRGC